MRSIINREQDYAIRIVAYLVGRGRELVSIKQLASRLAIPESMATKIALRLTNEGMLTSRRGRAGGVHISGDPERISVLDVLTAMGFELQMNECTAGDRTCPLDGECKVHGFFMKEQRKLERNLAEQMVIEIGFSDDALGGRTSARPATKP